MLAPTENMIPDIVYKVDAKKLSALISVKRDIKIDRIVNNNRDYPSDCVNRKLRDFSRSFFIYVLTL